MAAGHNDSILVKALFEAVKENQIRRIQVLLSAGVPVTVVNRAGDTLLDVAGSFAMFEWLRKAGANVNAMNSTRQVVSELFRPRALQASLLVQIVGGSRQRLRLPPELWAVIIKEFLGISTTPETSQQGKVSTTDENFQQVQNPPIDMADEDGLTALHWVAQAGDVRKVQEFLAAGIGINVENNEERTPLDLAALAGQIEVVWILLAAGARIDGPNPKRPTALHLAVEANHIEVAKLLCAAGANSDYNKVGEIGFADRIFELSQQNMTCWVDDKRRTLLHQAVIRGCTPVVRSILAIDAKGNPCIDPNARDESGRTALHQAALQGSYGMIWSLLNDTNPLLLDSDGKTASSCVPVGSACQALLEAATTLANRRSTPEQEQAARGRLWGLDLWHTIVTGNDERLCQLLKDKRMKVNDPIDKSGNGPLHAAALYGNAKAVEALLAVGADPNKPNIRGQTPCDIAMECGHSSVVTLLEEAAKTKLQLAEASAAPALEAGPMVDSG